MRTLMLLPVLLVTIASVGCSISNDMKWSKFRSNVFNESRHKEFDQDINPQTIPQRMAVIWHDATATQSGSTPTRGFGGRIYFYNYEEKPIEVDGELVIYGYDDTDSDQRKSSPDKKFVFEAHELERHVGESDLGVSYNIWIPWDKVGDFRKNIGLVAVFKGTKGEIVKGGHSVNILPGPMKEKENEFEQYAKQAKGLHLAYTGFDSPANRQVNNGMSDKMPVGEPGQVNYRSAVVPTTIPIPHDTQRRIEAMRNEIQNSDVIRKAQQEQARKMAEQMNFSGDMSTKVVYGKQDVEELLGRKKTLNQSFSPAESMMNGGSNGAINQDIALNQTSEKASGFQGGFQSGIQQTSATMPPESSIQAFGSTQSNTQQPEARRVFGRPGSFR